MNPHDQLRSKELKAALEQMKEPDRYAEIMRRVARGELIPRQFRFFVSYYEVDQLKLPEAKQTFRITEKLFRDHRAWLQMMRERWKKGGCGDILPLRQKPRKQVVL